GTPDVAGGRPVEAPKPPNFAGDLTAEGLRALHKAVSAYYSVVRQSRRLPLAALAYTLPIQAGVVERVLTPAPTHPGAEGSPARLRAALAAFDELAEVWKRLHGAPPMLADVAPRLEHLIARAIDDAEPAATQRDAVQVMTVHQAKGLQFEVVFLSGFAQGLF